MILDNINIGVIGDGHSGVAEAGYLSALGFNVLLYNRTVKNILKIIKNPLTR